ncbi:MAG: hypothetical protein ACKVXR_15820 [Planctomycetota bacterium]
MPLLSFSRARSAWSDPERKLKTLESFARTEADGGRDIVAAQRIVRDAELKAHLERHAQDELRHAELFHRRAAELRAQGVAATREEESDKPYDLSLSRGKLAASTDGHGFLKFALADELGEVGYVAMLHVAEKRAAKLFRDHERYLTDDPETRAIFASILKDEHYHVAYTGTLLRKWKKEGRGMEVKRALSLARGSRFLGAWKRFGARSAAGLTRAILLVMYFTVLAPFGFLARGRTAKAGWKKPLAERAVLERLRSQYG